MGIRRSLSRHKCQHLGTVKLDRLARCQIIRQNDRLLHLHGLRAAAVMQNGDQTLGNIFDVRRTRLHVLIIHAGEHRRKVVPCRSNGKLCIDLLCRDNVADGIAVILIVQHHLMYLEDRRIVLSDFLYRFVIECSQLLHGNFFRLLKARTLSCGIIDM